MHLTVPIKVELPENWVDMVTERLVSDGLYYNIHEVATIISELLCDDCACNFNGNDEWLPQYCEFSETCCPKPVGVACWEQYLKHRSEKED